MFNFMYLFLFIYLFIYLGSYLVINLFLLLLSVTQRDQYVCHNNFWYNLNQVVNYYTLKAQTAENLHVPAGFFKIGECVVTWNM